MVDPEEEGEGEGEESVVNGSGLNLSCRLTLSICSGEGKVAASCGGGNSEMYSVLEVGSCLILRLPFVMARDSSWEFRGSALKMFPRKLRGR